MVRPESRLILILMQKLGFRLYELEFFTKQATPPPLRDRSDLTRPYRSISMTFYLRYSKKPSRHV